MNWRLIESALVRIAKANVYHVEQDANGDSFAVILADEGDEPRVNLTELAKDLASDLKPLQVKA